MLKTLGNIQSIKLGKSKIKTYNSDKKEIDNIIVDNNEVSNNKVENKKNYEKMFKFKKLIKPKNFSNFFISETRLAFTKFK